MPSLINNQVEVGQIGGQIRDISLFIEKSGVPLSFALSPDLLGLFVKFWS